MVQYIVSQRPKPKYRNSYVTVMMVVEANSAADAIRNARDAYSKGRNTLIGSWFRGHDLEYCKPQAFPLHNETLYRF